jgi:SAM-dependent methyltransferase
MPDKSGAFEAVEADDGYVMGRNARETERLQRQAVLYDPSTRSMLEQAGTRAGMRVLDLGCGAGDVSLIAAELVGQQGSVLGIDADATVLDTASRRARQLPQVSFLQAPFESAELDGEFDAIVGRLVLIYQRDPAAVLRRFLPHLARGGIVAFQEIDFRIGPNSTVRSPLLEDIWRWANAMFRGAGLNPCIGTSLQRVFLDAGLPEPAMSFYAPVGGSAAFAGYDYLERSVRSGLPNLIKLGIATADDVAIDTLAARLRGEIAERRGVFALPALVSAWTRR